MAAAPMRNDVPQPKSGILDPNHPLHDPDLIKMAESGPHSRTVDLLVLAVQRLLGDDVWAFRDLNWYPPDDGNAIAPDVMVLPRNALDQPPKSYLQRNTGGPNPLVVIEVASDSDGFASLLTKTHRYRGLEVVAYIIVLDGAQGVLRSVPDDVDLVSWTGRPMPELGGCSIDFVDETPRLTMPDGLTATATTGLLAATEDRADRAEGEIEALRAQLRDLGVDPDRAG